MGIFSAQFRMHVNTRGKYRESILRANRNVYQFYPTAPAIVRRVPITTVI